jgi:hypothetical protein
MKVFFCSDCGAEYEVDEAEGRQRKRLCFACRRIEAKEKELLREWELARGYAE